MIFLQDLDPWRTKPCLHRSTKYGMVPYRNYLNSLSHCSLGQTKLNEEPGASKILLVDAKSIFSDYHTINGTQITDAAAVHINDRAIQNSSALFKCLESSIVGDLKYTIFSQSDNISTNEDGISLFKLLTIFTTVAPLQLSMISFNHILNFDPSEFNFSIPKINSKLINLFLLATTKTHKLLDSERIQHTLNA